MAYDDEVVSQLRLTAVDDTAQVMAQLTSRVAGMQQVFRQLNTGIAQVGGTLQQSQQQLQNWLSTFNQTVNTANTGVQRLGQQTGFLNQQVGSLGDQLKRYLTAGAIEEFVRTSYTGFARVQRGMELISNATGATTEQLTNLGTTFAQLAAISGRSISELEEDYRQFMATTTLAFEPARQAFDQITRAAIATGTNFQDMGRAAAAAMNNLKVSQGDLQGLLDAWATEIPDKMMGAFAQVAPRLTEEMATVGMTGKQAAIDIAAAFTEVGKALGNPRQAASALNDTLRMMGDLSTPVGRHLVGVMQQIHDGTARPLDAWRQMLSLMQQVGAFSENLMERWAGRKILGMDEQQVRVMQVMRDHWDEIQKDVAKTGEDMLTVAQRMAALGGDSLSAVQRLGAAFEELQHQFAELMVAMGADTALVGVADAFKAIADSIALVVDGMKWIKEHSGTGTPADQARQAASPYKVDPRVAAEATQPLPPLASRIFKDLFIPGMGISDLTAEIHALRNAIEGRKDEEQRAPAPGSPEAAARTPPGRFGLM